MHRCQLGLEKLPDHRWQMKLNRPLTRLEQGTLTVVIKDRLGNTSRIERRFSVRNN